MPSAGLRPQHKQDPVSGPKLTSALGFSHGAAPRRWVRSRCAGAGQEESCEEGKKAQGGQPLPQLTCRHPRGVPPVPARSPQQSWGLLPPGPCSDPSKPLPNSQQLARPRLRAPQTEVPLSFPNTRPFICPQCRWANRGQVCPNAQSCHPHQLHLTGAGKPRWHAQSPPFPGLTPTFSTFL